MRERRGIAFSGFIAISVVMDGRNRQQGDPSVICVGLPDEVVDRANEAAVAALDNLRRGDDDAKMAEEIRRVVRRAVNDYWRKKPVVKVEIIRI